MITFHDGAFWWKMQHRVFGMHRILAEAYGYNLDAVKRSAKSRSGFGGGGVKAGTALDRAIDKYIQGKKVRNPRVSILASFLKERKWIPVETQKCIGAEWIGTAIDLICTDSFGRQIIVSLKTGYNTKDNPLSDLSFRRHTKKSAIPSALERAVAQVDAERLLFAPDAGATVLLVNPAIIHMFPFLFFLFFSFFIKKKKKKEETNFKIK
jgi:hypothetical protein